MAPGSGKPRPRSTKWATLVGQTIGDFEVLEEIGRGGMGVVFRARQMSLDRVVALKVLSTGLGLTDQAVVRFQREAQATAKLQHPNIVPIFAQGKEDDVYFYAMALVGGRSLRDIITELGDRDEGGGGTTVGARGGSGMAGGSSAMAEDLALAETELLEQGSGGAARSAASSRATVIEDSVAPTGRLDSKTLRHYTGVYFDEIARQVCAVADALDYAHRQGVIHRDIKPHNLLIGDSDRLCLSDFGLARVLEQPGVTMTGEFVGSPLYMSPEQITGRGGPAGEASDVYSLGATLYEWLTLSPPFPGQTREEVISRVLTADPVPPRALNNRVPLDLETICLKALSKDASHRYQSAAAMRDDLRRFVDRAGIKARRAGPVTAVWRALSRRRVAATILIAAVVVSALSMMLVREQRQTQQVVATKQQEVDAVREDYARLQERTTALANKVAERLRQGEAPFAEPNRGGPWLPGLLLVGEEQPAKYEPITEGQRLGAMFVSLLREKETRRLQNVDPDSISPQSAEWHYLAALAERSAEPALAHLGACLSVRSSYVEAHLLRAWVYCQLSNGAGMLREAAQIQRFDEQHAEAHAVRAVANLLLGHYESALADLAKAEAAMGSDYHFYLLQGMALAGLGEIDKAIVSLSAAQSTNENCVLAYLQRAALRMEWKQYLPAIFDLTRVLSFEPQNAEALVKRAECYDHLEQYDKAYKDYTLATSISGEVELLEKAGAAARNRDEEQAASEAQVAAGDDEAADDRTPTKVIKPPESPSAALEWLQRFVKPRQDDPDAQSRRPSTDSPVLVRR